MLVDVKDTSKTWYQACVLEIWHKENVEQIPKTNPIIISDASLVVADATEILSDNSINEGQFEKSSCLCAISTDMKDKMIIDEEEKENYEEAAIASMDICCSAESSPEKSRAINASDIDISMVVQVSDCIPTVSDSEKVMLRIAYLGMPERHDEWISIDSNRIRKVNTYSNGKRGNQINIREEILFLSSQLVENEANYEYNEYINICRRCFIPTFYFEIVDMFVSANGLLNILSLLHNELSKKKMQSTISIIVAMNCAHKAIPASILATFVNDFVDISSKVILNITLTELRQIQLEVLEQALMSLENVSFGYLGRNCRAGQLIEPLYFELAMILVNSPYLNKRHGGLKVLSDLLRRAQNYKEAPNGIKITKSINSNNIENISYKVVPILHYLKLDDLCRKISDTDIIRNMFIGELSHDSLMTKSTDILKPMAQEGFLDVNIINTIWDLGFCMRNVVAMQALVDIIPFMDVESSLLLIDGPVSSVNVTSATVHVIDLVAAMGMKARDLLMLKRINNSQVHAAQTMKLHSKALLKLWDWGRDESGTMEAVALTCSTKIESIFNIGVSFANACVKPDFPWSVQLERTNDILISSMSSIREGKSIVPSIKVLQSFVSSWPEKGDFNPEVANLSNTSLPFKYPFRCNVSEFLNEKFRLIVTITDTLLLIKSKFINETTMRNSDEAIQNLYRHQNNTLLNFIHSFVRCSDDLIISQDVINRVWSGMMMSTEMQFESDHVINFIRRLVIKGGSETRDEEKSVNKRSSVCLKEDVLWTFTSLLCNTTFIQSKKYSLAAYQCMERYFRWLNIDAGYIVETAGKQQFEIVKTPSSLIGINVFFIIILTCTCDNVANTATNFLMSLPERVSVDMMKEGEQVSLRNTFLSNCIKELYIAKSNRDYSLKRLFMLLTGTLLFSITLLLYLNNC